MLLLLAFFKGCQHCQPLSVGNLPQWAANLASGRDFRTSVLMLLHRRCSVGGTARRAHALYEAQENRLDHRDGCTRIRRMFPRIGSERLD
jgi:hypothetical protein